MFESAEAACRAAHFVYASGSRLSGADIFRSVQWAADHASRISAVGTRSTWCVPRGREPIVCSLHQAMRAWGDFDIDAAVQA